MSAARRKITFQLTSLLDLLLIVIFAQYLEMSQTEQQQSGKMQLALQQQSIAENQARLAADQVTRSQAELAARSVEQTAALQLMAELLAIPEATLAEATTGKTSEDLERVRRNLAELTGGQAADVVHRLVTIAELRRASEIWTVHLDDDNVVRVVAGQRTTSFRADSPAEFQRKLWDWYRTLPPAKSLVLLQVTWGDAAFGPVVAAKQGVVTATEKMRLDRNGRSIFEYVILGFRPAG